MKNPKKTNTILSPLQLEHYELDEVHVKANNAWRPTKHRSPRREIEVEFEFYAGRIETETPMFSFQLRVALNSSPSAFKAADYQCAMTLRSFFSCTSDADERKTYDRIVLPYALAMTYSIARGIVASLTGNSSFGPLILPTVNMHEVIRRKLE